ncbi:hypothetical protein [Sanguibacter antarcticus]|uniref:Uncharacterized protein n=1 Tax=Sanguibacter antarcticus TaxID=372484 RepID=A0A2A9E1Q4_9MICO|nr:hypothetical protein [Sanguibacter antarcticus]PFG32576.1 hypothetical protein ATL42_0416 [Sanguibacter antarcticus]
MRWEMLFADLAGQLTVAQALELDSAVADLTRAETATITLEDRLRAVVGRPLHLLLDAGLDLQGELREAASEWLLLVVSGREVIVPLRAVESVRGLGVRAAPGAGGPGQGRAPSILSLGHALRGISRDRTVVRVRTPHREYVGRINRVGRDHLDVAAVPLDGRGGGAPADVVVIAVSSIAHVSAT